jgi:hypothetical protein
MFSCEWCLPVVGTLSGPHFLGFCDTNHSAYGVDGIKSDNGNRARSACRDAVMVRHDCACV